MQSELNLANAEMKQKKDIIGAMEATQLDNNVAMTSLYTKWKASEDSFSTVEGELKRLAQKQCVPKDQVDVLQREVDKHETTSDVLKKTEEASVFLNTPVPYMVDRVREQTTCAFRGRVNCSASSKQM